MRVLHIIKDLEPGGIQSLLLDMFNNKSYFNGEMALLTMGKGRLKEDFRKAAGKNFYETERNILIDPKTINFIRKTALNFKVDIVHTHHSVEMLHAYYALRKYPKIKLANTYHVSPKINTKKDLFVTKKIEKHFDYLITPSQALKDEMHKAGFRSASRYTVISNGLDEKRVKTTLSKEECRKKLKLNPHHFIIGMAGSFYTQIRDHKTLCKAFTLIDENDTSDLVLAGARTSSYFANKTSAEDCVNICKNAGKLKQLVFLDHINPIADFYGAIDLYVHSSKHDTFGLAPMEACFNNLPVILSDLAVFREIYSTYNAIDFFSIADYKELALLLHQHIKKEKQAVNATANNFFIENYSIKKYISALSSMY